MSKRRDASSHPALPIFVERLAVFLRRKPYPEPAVQAAAAPVDLGHILEELGHHIVVLTLVARADDAILDKERNVIFRYCVERAAKMGTPLNAGEKRALKDYLSDFSPWLAMLEGALARLKSDSKADLEKLLEAAHEVVEADHVYRMDEVAFLIALRRDLATL